VPDARSQPPITAAVDVGNSALKVARVEPSTLRIVSEATVPDAEMCRRLLAEWPPGRLLVSNVRPGLSAGQLAPSAEWLVVPAQALLAHSPIRFAESLDLGEDRQLACVAAAELIEQPFAVSTIGTAATLSLVHHAVCEFSVIWAGPGLQVEALRAHTRLDVPLDLRRPLVPPRTATLGDSVNVGVWSSTAFTLERWLDVLERAVGESISLVLTGGFAPAVSAHLSTPHRVEPLLTIKGLLALAAYGV